MGKRKCKSYFGDYKCHAKTNVKDSKGNFIYVDKCLKEAVENLNAVGLKTVASCCGHGVINPKITIEGLSDGMEVDLKNSKCNKHIVINNEERVAVCDHCNDTGWDSYPNHSTTMPPCPKCQH